MMGMYQPASPRNRAWSQSAPSPNGPYAVQNGTSMPSATQTPSGSGSKPSGRKRAIAVGSARERQLRDADVPIGRRQLGVERRMHRHRPGVAGHGLGSPIIVLSCSGQVSPARAAAWMAPSRRLASEVGDAVQAIAGERRLHQRDARRAAGGCGARRARALGDLRGAGGATSVGHRTLQQASRRAHPGAAGPAAGWCSCRCRPPRWRAPGAPGHRGEAAGWPGRGAR